MCWCSTTARRSSGSSARWSTPRWPRRAASIPSPDTACMKSTTTSPTPPAASLARRIAIAALLIAVGNIASRVLGLARESVIAGTFGRGVEIDVFTAAATIPTTLYDLLINGAISAALVPVFSEYAEGDEREFWRVASIVINLALLVMAAVVALLIWL